MRRTLASLLLCRLAVFAAFAAPPAVSPTVEPAESASAEELDRPGEVENPFTLAPGRTELVGYMLAANPLGRENQELGTGGSALLLQAGVRFGVSARWEGQVFVDTFANAIDKGFDGDDPGRARAGLGFLTLRAKAQVIGNATSDYAVAVVPVVRFSTSRILTGWHGAEPGLIVAFDFDLEHGWEIQGSTGVTYGHGDNGSRATEWETQSSLEWNFAPRWSAYVEPELSAGEGAARWATEQGVTFQITPSWHLDTGFNTGLGRSSRAHFGYAGAGFAF